LVFATGKLESPPTWHVTGGDVYRMRLTTSIAMGWSNEGSPFYDNLSFNASKVVADVLDGYEGYRRRSLPASEVPPDVTGGRALSRWMPIFRRSASRRYRSAGHRADRGIICGGLRRKYGDPSMAQLAYLPNKNSTVGLNSGIFSADPAAQRHDPYADHDRRPLTDRRKT